MTTDMRFTLVISGIGLLLLIATSVLGILWRAAVNVTKVNSSIKDQGNDIKHLTEALDLHIKWHLDQNNNRQRR